MLGHAQSVDSRQYVVYEGKIGYKYLDGITTSYYYGYYTAFAYKNECDNGNVQESTMIENIGLFTNCGRSSYAEIPCLFDVVLGGTGTLQALRHEEKQLLEDVYDINKFAYIPSVYGKNKLGFAGDNPRGKVLAEKWEVCLML